LKAQEIFEEKAFGLVEELDCFEECNAMSRLGTLEENN